MILQKDYILQFLAFIGLLILPFSLLAQDNTLTGKVFDKENKEALIGANVYLKSSPGEGTTTNARGEFSLQVNNTADTVVISSLGFATQEIVASGISNGATISLERTSYIIPGGVVSASRYNESVLQAPVTVQKVSASQIQSTAAGDYYEGLGYLPQVDIINNSFGFKVFNSRGFNTTTPFRVVNYIDGMDNQSIGINMSPGDLFGIPDIDLASTEVISGPASALYGPYALQGVISMKSKDPFDYPGISAKVKGGNRQYAEGQFRIADSYGSENHKFGFKVAASYFRADDWEANDPYANVYVRNLAMGPPTHLGVLAQGLENDTTLTAAQQQLYADFNNYVDSNANAGLGPVIHIAPGYEEKYLVEDHRAEALKLNIGAHYRFLKKYEFLYNYKYARASAIFQANNRATFTNFEMHQGKAELKSDKFSVKYYFAKENSGDSYNILGTGAALSFAAKDNLNQIYLNSYIDTLQGLTNNFTTTADSTSIAIATGYARAQSANGYLQPGTPIFDKVFDAITTSSARPNGTALTTTSIMHHVEGQYNYRLLDWVDMVYGASFRLYDPQSKGTVFSDTLMSNGEYKDISYKEYSGYVQATKKLANDKLKLQASVRFDKSENYDLQVSPRGGIVYTVKKNHNIRLAAQSAFRSPTSNDQFFLLNAGALTVVGNLNGLDNIYTAASVGAAQATNDASLLVKTSVDRVEPEQLTSAEIGYRGVIAKKLLIDFSAYFNRYKNFIGNVVVVTPNNGVAGEASGAMDVLTRQTTTYRVPVNASQDVNSYGASIALTYYIGHGISAYGNYTFSNIEDEFAVEDSSDLNGDLVPGFNTPKHKFNIGLQGRKVWKGLGFSANLRWQDDFFWESAFASGPVPSFYTLDVQLSYEIEKAYTTIRLGAANITDNDHIEAYGAGMIGGFYYASLTFDLPYLKKQKTAE